MRATAPLAAALFCVFLTLVSAPPADAKTAVLEMKTGRIIEGELVAETDDNVILRVSGIDTPFPRSDIKTMTLRQTPEEIYQERRSELKDDDLDGRFALAYDLFEMKAYRLAKQEVEDLLAAYPDEKRFQRLATVIDDSIALLEDQNADQDQAPSGDERPGTVVRPPMPEADVPTDAGKLRDMQLTDEDINLIRIWELPADPDDFRDLAPRIIIPMEAINRFLEEYSADLGEQYKGRANQNQFRRAPGWEQLEEIFNQRAREFYKEVRVVQDPPVMLTYRRQIAPLYVNDYFARTFGQGQVEGLFLFGGRGERLRADYTDFYILSNYQAAVDQWMIDRQEPGRSLLLQWGLPRDQAAFPAPDVPGWRPFFSSREDPKYQTIVDWISTLYPAPEYGITYQTPEVAAPGGAESEPEPEPEAEQPE